MSALPDPLVNDVAAVQAIAIVEDILRDVCALTGMRFAAVARVTTDRWIACQVLDQIEFGLTPGGELEISTTICDEIRQSGRLVVIDDVDADPDWVRHRTPMLYGFKSYVSIPIVLADGSFFGTLCAIDPAARTESIGARLPELQAFATRIAQELDAQRG